MKTKKKQNKTTTVVCIDLVAKKTFTNVLYKYLHGTTTAKNYIHLQTVINLWKCRREGVIFKQNKKNIPQHYQLNHTHSSASIQYYPVQGCLIFVISFCKLTVLDVIAQIKFNKIWIERWRSITLQKQKNNSHWPPKIISNCWKCISLWLIRPGQAYHLFSNCLTVPFRYNCLWKLAGISLRYYGRITTNALWLINVFINFMADVDIFIRFVMSKIKNTFFLVEWFTLHSVFSVGYPSLHSRQLQSFQMFLQSTAITTNVS